MNEVLDMTHAAAVEQKRQERERHSDFLRSLVDFTKEHRAARWTGTLAAFLEGVFPSDPKGITRSSHQYMWDMMRCEERLFDDELYGIDDTLERVRDYFKAAARRLRSRPPPAAAARAALRAASRAW